MENQRIGDHLDDIADLLELEEGNEFRVRAYRAAARKVREHTARFADLVEEERDLTELNGIGESIADDIEELVRTGSCERLDALREAAPAELPEIMRVRGLDARNLDHDALADLDWVVASVHSHFDQSEADMTKRLLRAIESGVIDCLGHPVCRQIGRRDGVRFAAEEVFSACAEHGVALEINANPTRLDLPDTHAKLAREAGARLVINTDAHRVNDLGFMGFGVDVARRGWLRAADVPNTGRTEQILRHRRKIS